MGAERSLRVIHLVSCSAATLRLGSSTDGLFSDQQEDASQEGKDRHDDAELAEGNPKQANEADEDQIDGKKSDTEVFGLHTQESDDDIWLALESRKVLAYPLLSSTGMPDLNAATLEFIYALLKKQQLRLARSAHRASFAREQKIFTNIQNRLLLELSYGENAGGAH